MEFAILTTTTLIRMLNAHTYFFSSEYFIQSHSDFWQYNFSMESLNQHLYVWSFEMWLTVSHNSQHTIIYLPRQSLFTVLQLKTYVSRFSHKIRTHTHSLTRSSRHSAVSLNGTHKPGNINNAISNNTFINYSNNSEYFTWYKLHYISSYVLY